MSLYEYCPDPFYDNCEDYRPKQKPTCNHCGKSNLMWGRTVEGWRLYEGYDKPHVCQVAVTPDDFGDVT